MKLLAELDTGKGVGLIERIKQGQGKPTRIYVKRFTTQELPPQCDAERRLFSCLKSPLSLYFRHFVNSSKLSEN